MKKWVLYALLVVVAWCSAEQGWCKNLSQMNDAGMVLPAQSSCLVTDMCSGKVVADPNSPVSVSLYSFGARREIVSKEESKLKKWNKDVFACHMRAWNNRDFEAETHLNVYPYFDRMQSRLAYLQRLNI